MFAIKTLIYVAVLSLTILIVSLSRQKRKGRIAARGRGAILMYVTDNLLQGWAKYSIAVNRAYARTHGYTFRIRDLPYDKSVTHAWQKIPAIIDLLVDHDFVFYIDADAVFHNHSIRLETILHKYPGDVIMCSDHANSGGLYAVNGGTVLARNSGLPLLSAWWSLRSHYSEFAFEQWAMSDIVRGKILGGENFHVSVAPENEFNSKYSDLVQYADKPDPDETPNLFVLHFMAMTDEKREKSLKVEFDKWCGRSGSECSSHVA